MKFQKGQSGNPAGRPKLTQEDRDIRKMALAHAEAAVSRLVAWMNDESQPAASVAASKEILDRAFGKANQHMTLKDERDLSKWSDADLKAAIVAELTNQTGVAAPANGSGLPH